jgi:hypothetical protein
MAERVAHRMAEGERRVGALEQGVADLKLSLTDLEGDVYKNAGLLNEQIQGLGEQAVRLNDEIRTRQEQGVSLEAQIKGVQQDVGKMTAKDAFDTAMVMRQKLLIELTELKTKALAQLKLNPKDRDTSKTQADVEALIAEIAKEGVAEVKLGPDSIKKSNMVGWSSMVSADIWEKLAAAEIKEKDTYKLDKATYSASQASSSNIELIKLGNYLSQLGRERGPDFVLKVSSNIKERVKFADDAEPKLTNLINEQTTITEVLNILAFLTSKSEEKSFDPELSIKSGEHNMGGEYVGTPSDIYSETKKTELDSWKLSSELKNKQSLLVLDNGLMQPSSEITDVYIPQGILKRGMNNGAVGPIKLRKEDVLPLFMACIYQMNNICVNVRKTFNGWTLLSTATSGGGSKSKSKTKKNRHSKRRSNRRKY